MLDQWKHTPSRATTGIDSRDQDIAAKGSHVREGNNHYHSESETTSAERDCVPGDESEEKNNSTRDQEKQGPEHS